MPPGLHELATWSGERLNVVIETPKNQPNKLAYDPDAATMRLSKVLPVGMVFPFDFGFIPSTLGEDGDPLDVLVLMDAPVPAGCLVYCSSCRRPAMFAAGRANDRRSSRTIGFLAVAAEASTYRGIRDILDLNGPLHRARSKRSSSSTTRSPVMCSRSSVDKEPRLRSVPWSRHGLAPGARWAPNKSAPVVLGAHALCRVANKWVNVRWVKNGSRR